VTKPETILSFLWLGNVSPTVGGMKRLGLRIAFLSTETKADAGYNARITTKTQMFYDRVLCGVHFINLSYKSVFVIYLSASHDLSANSIFIRPK
jgi:hypothetical protein